MPRAKLVHFERLAALTDEEREGWPPLRDGVPTHVISVVCGAFGEQYRMLKSGDIEDVTCKNCLRAKRAEWERRFR